MAYAHLPTEAQVNQTLRELGYPHLASDYTPPAETSSHYKRQPTPSRAQRWRYLVAHAMIRDWNSIREQLKGIQQQYRDEIALLPPGATPQWVLDLQPLLDLNFDRNIDARELDDWIQFKHPTDIAAPETDLHYGTTRFQTSDLL